MPLCNGKPYLLIESSKFLVDLQQIAVIFADIQANLETLATIYERLNKVEASLKNCNEHKEPDPNRN